MNELIFQNDNSTMNWLRPDYEYADVVCPAPLTCEVVNRWADDRLETEITITNKGSKPFFSHVGDIAISFPLQDKYEDSQTCTAYRCHTHIFCGGDISYIMALRMGGDAPHLGMVLTKGSLLDYSVERDVKKQSNDRGCFWLHPSPMEFDAGESKQICWTIFQHEGKEDFKNKLGQLSQYIGVEANRYVLFLGETGEIRITPSFPVESILIDGKAYPVKEGACLMQFSTDRCGERRFEIEAGGIRTWCRVCVIQKPDALVSARCDFIAKHQQYHGRITQLEGAYLAYDNEDGTCVYTPENDYNGGRERIGMGLLVSEYLQGDHIENRAFMEESLQRYVSYLERELVDKNTGNVCNDIGRDDSFHRLYNLPWVAELYCELYQQYGDTESLSIACRVMRKFYEEGGTFFYPLELPVVMLIRSLERAGMKTEEEEMKSRFIRHADLIIKTDLDYPPLEVNFEQSIVAPAADILLSVYMITGDNQYLQAGKRQMDVLDLFNGIQPDYHLYETAIRHWDGYWFGKRRLYGDTFPHYWSALTGEVFEKYGRITGDASYLKRAEDSKRGVLTLIFPNGAASCAYLYPYSVNGVRASFYDPYANDQDWGLYIYYRSKRECITEMVE